uniref:Vang-like protein n=1 Tax=Trichogramma kaykai TaxID=54128 RepID=A0ABD2VRH4_9HYME
MAPFQTTVNIRQSKLEDTSHDDIDLEILHSEETWTENTTVITENTSDRSTLDEKISTWSSKKNSKRPFQNCISNMITMAILIVSLISPVIMIIWPKFNYIPENLSILTTQQKISYSSCNLECKGHLISLIFKIFLLLIGSYIVIGKKNEAFTPRFSIFKTGTILVTLLCTCSFWLFYIVQITDAAKNAITGEIAEYKILVKYAGNFVDTLMLIQLVAVLSNEIIYLKPKFYLKVIRSPDGVSKSYAIGQLSIQRAAVWILEKYYTEFPVYNPYLERLPVSRSSKKHVSSNFKFYNVDEHNDNSTDRCNRNTFKNDFSSLCSQSRKRDSSHNERFYDENEYEKRVRKRRARLISAAEEAFAHIQRINSDAELIDTNLLTPMEAAQSVFPSMARPLQKYLRITRQQPRHTVDAILERLAKCLAQDATPRAFLEHFLVTAPVLSNEKEKLSKYQHWALVCEGELPSRSLTNGCEFQLRQGDIALLCTVYQLPRLFITEKMALPISNKFLLKLNTETPI